MHHFERLLAPRAFIFVDCFFVVVALIAAFCSADHVSVSTNLGALLATRLTLQNLLRAASVFAFWAVLMRAFRTYTDHTFHPLSEALRIAAAAAGTSLVLFASFDQQHKGASAQHIAADFAIFCFLSMYGVRAAVSLLGHYSHSAILGRRSVIIVGTGPRAIRAFRDLRTNRHNTHSLLGFVDSRSKSVCPGEIESMYMGSLNNLDDILLKHVVDEVIIALPARSCYSDIEQAIQICTRVGVEVRYPDDLLPFAPGASAGAASRSNPAMIVLRPAAHDARLLVKRLVDLVASSVAIVLLLPLMAVLAAVIKLTSHGPVFFMQERYGLGRRRFRMYKFRTMVVDAEARLKEIESLNEAHGPIFKMRNDPRITKAGAFLRKTSLDELPQLFNVFLGHMSLVGPRPMSVRDVSLFNEAWLMRRFSVKPGITCLWQVKGRSNTSFNRWMELDLHYIDNWSLGLDVKILALTIPAVVKGSGAM